MQFGMRAIFYAFSDNIGIEIWHKSFISNVLSDTPNGSSFSWREFVSKEHVSKM